jgi:hypothetical protein
MVLRTLGLAVWLAIVSCGEVVDVFDPSCTEAEDFDATCPDGQEMSNCGGNGGPCCCLPTPMPGHRCVAPTGCDGSASCECLGEELCTGGRVCVPFYDDPERLFRCESQPE